MIRFMEINGTWFADWHDPEDWWASAVGRDPYVAAYRLFRFLKLARHWPLAAKQLKENPPLCGI